MKKRLCKLLIPILSLTLCLSGCGASYSESTVMDSYQNSFPSNSYDGMKDFGYSNDEYLSEEAIPEMETSAAGSSVNDSINKNTSDVYNEYLSSQKLIYTANVNVETKNFEQSIADLKTSIANCNGFIEADSLVDDNVNWYYSDSQRRNKSLIERMTVRIPSENYRSFLEGCDKYGKVLSKNENVANITKAYADTETSIEALRIQEQRLLEMLEQCTDIPDMIYVEERLSEVQRRLMSYQSTIGQYDLNVAYSTIYITVTEVIEYTPEPIEKMTFLDELIESFNDMTEEFVEILQDILLWVVGVAPILLVRLIIFCSVVWCIFRVFVFFFFRDKYKEWKQKRKENKALKKQKKEVHSAIVETKE